ncbi:thiamine pyrophosphate-dependent enzyme [Bacilliculturomica massiliensis]|uniref:thiamine pyrophosphate-dependent enzyme n=1 Tax=Bacilliculturomica massiliensis TaxID=1917867 RepID=UPI0010317881|nr:thiamine pyrophosphate-dependent enzyme [Bacilliculturomica massiliensis]
MTEKKNLLASGHKACPGCTVPIAVNKVLEATGKNVIVVTATGCLETFTSLIDFSSWEVPWITPLFENAAAVGAGVAAALEAKDGNERDTKVVAFGGDGSTYDIGFGALSGMLERNDNVIYVCYDNEAYMNTGVQRSSGTPFAATTTTSPCGEASFGNIKYKKNMPEIARAHGIHYVATAAISDLKDLKKKVEKAMAVKGASYLHILTPCNVGWGFPSEKSVEMARLTVNAGLFPIIEYTDGELTAVKKIKKIPVEDALFVQKRFKHLKKDEYAQQLKQVQAIADANIARYGL